MTTPYPSVRTVSRALPPHRASQDEMLEAFREIWSAHPEALERMQRVRSTIGVEERHFVLPPRAYGSLPGFAARNAIWRAAAVELTERAVERALEQAGLSARDVDALVFLSTTGISTPSIDALLVNRLGMRPDVKRTPIFGFGCGGGGAGLLRAADFLRAYPDHICLVVALELCSLTFQVDDLSPANQIAALLFGDGASAVVLAGGARARPGEPRILDGASRLYPGSEHMGGWEVVDGGFKLILSPEIPAFWREHLRPEVDRFLASHGLRREQVAHWAVHTGGPKILEAFADTLALPDAALQRAWRVLRHTGNLSSVSVLLSLADMLEQEDPGEGAFGVVLTMGPGLCTEALLLRW